MILRSEVTALHSEVFWIGLVLGLVIAFAIWFCLALVRAPRMDDEVTVTKDQHRRP